MATACATGKNDHSLLLFSANLRLMHLVLPMESVCELLMVPINDAMARLIPRQSADFMRAKMQFSARSSIAAFIFAISLCGCLPRQVTNDGVNARQGLLEMYTDQIMDNLIRAHNNLPFVQIAYSDVTVQDNDQLGGTLSGTWPGSIFGANGNASRSRTLSVVSNPIVNQNEIYDAYIAFANRTDMFMATCDDPGSAAHICRKQDGIYYWVPSGAARAFLDLAMFTTFKRGADPVPLGWYVVSISDVEIRMTNPINEETKKPEYEGVPEDEREAILTLAPKVPSGDAMLVVEMENGRLLRIPLLRIPSEKVDGKNQPIEEGSLTDKLKTLPWSPAKEGYSENNLRGAKARLYSHDFPPEVNEPLPQIKSIGANLNFLRTIQAQSRRAP